MFPFRTYSRLLKLLGASALFTAFLFGSSAAVETVLKETPSKRSSRSVDQERVLTLLDEGDCAGAWDEMWKVARRGNSEVLADIALALIPFRAVAPPSYFSMTKNALKQHVTNQLMALQLYSRNDDRMSKQLTTFGVIPDKDIEENVAPDAADLVREVNRCLIGGNAMDICYDMAVKSKIIPSFSRYVLMIDNAPRRAFCSAGDTRNFH